MLVRRAAPALASAAEVQKAQVSGGAADNAYKGDRFARGPWACVGGSARDRRAMCGVAVFAVAVRDESPEGSSDDGEGDAGPEGVGVGLTGIDSNTAFAIVL